jgi:hypothetical protein
MPAASKMRSIRLHLVLHRQTVFKIQRGIGAESDPAIAFVREDLVTKLVSNIGVPLQAVQIVSCQFLHCIHIP